MIVVWCMAWTCMQNSSTGACAATRAAKDDGVTGLYITMYNPCMYVHAVESWCTARRRMVRGVGHITPIPFYYNIRSIKETQARPPVTCIHAKSVWNSTGIFRVGRGIFLHLFFLKARPTVWSFFIPRALLFMMRNPSFERGLIHLARLDCPLYVSY